MLDIYLRTKGRKNPSMNLRTWKLLGFKVRPTQEKKGWSSECWALRTWLTLSVSVCRVTASPPHSVVWKIFYSVHEPTNWLLYLESSGGQRPGGLPRPCRVCARVGREAGRGLARSALPHRASRAQRAPRAPRAGRGQTQGPGACQPSACSALCPKQVLLNPGASGEWEKRLPLFMRRADNRGYFIIYWVDQKFIWVFL